MDNVPGSIDRILAAHLSGNRDVYATIQNLDKLHASLPNDADRQTFNEYVEQRLREEIRALKPFEPSRPVNLFAILFRTAFGYGSPERVLPTVLAHLDPSDSAVVDSWSIRILPEISATIHVFAARLSPETLARFKSLVGTYTARNTSEVFGFHLPGKLADSIQRVENTIEEVEFQRFEESLGPAPARDALKVSSEDPLAALPTPVRDAVQEANRLLASTGQFTAKHAADLLRSCMDAAHRNIVQRLGAAQSVAYAYADRDGDRRRFMRERGFVTTSEEVFFSAIYSLISREGSHKLKAPRETILVLKNTVTEYLLLLYRRLTEVEARPGAAKNAQGR